MPCIAIPANICAVLLVVLLATAYGDDRRPVTQRSRKVEGLLNHDVASQFYRDVRTSDNEAAVVVIGGSEDLASQVDATFATSADWDLTLGSWSIAAGVASGTTESDEMATKQSSYSPASALGFVVEVFEVSARSAGSVRMKASTIPG